MAGNRQRRGKGSCSTRADPQYPVNQRRGKGSRSTRANLEHPVKQRRGKGSTSTRGELQSLVNQRRQHISRSTRANLQFPVSRIARFLRQGNYSQRLSSTSPVFLAGILQYVTSNILALAGEVARSRGKKRIAPEHLYQVVQDNVQLQQLLKMDTKSMGDMIQAPEDN